MPSRDVIISGSFTINHYTVTYVIDGKVYSTSVVTYGESIVLPEVPEREGYVFEWNGEIPEMMPAENIVINGSYVDTDISMIMNKDEILRIYTIDGKCINELRQGLNIVRMKDGSLRKVLVK